MNVKINLESSSILQKLQDPNEYAAAMKVGAVAAKNWMATTYYSAKNANEPNRLKGQRTNFWANIGRSIQNPLQKGMESIIRILDPRIAQKVYGGTIRAKRVTYLTIPISKEAYGMTARVLERNLGTKIFPIKSKKGNRLLVSKVDGQLKPHYLLKQEVNQKPWPGALPPAKDLSQKFTEGVEEHLFTRANLS